MFSTRKDAFRDATLANSLENERTVSSERKKRSDMNEERNEPSIPRKAPHSQTNESPLPLLTEDDIRRQMAGRIHTGSIKRVGQPQIPQLTLMTTHEASGLIHNFISFQTDALVCYVEFHGTFLFAGGPLGYQGGNIPHETNVFEIIDAQTGNCLVKGFVTK